MRWLALLLLLFASPAAAGEALGPPAGAAWTAELTLPSGSGPFPAMVILHGCNGVAPHYRTWAQRLAGWGYAALLVDSFHSRGVESVCNHGRIVPPAAQAADGLEAAALLRGRADIRPERIGVIGFSHGGWAVLKAVLDPGPALPFAAAVAFYPGCERPLSPLVTDTLILIGEADDWTPVAHCRAWRDAADAGGHQLELVTYPGAVHGFDTVARRRLYAGHAVGGDPVAGPDAIARARSFLAARLQPGG